MIKKSKLFGLATIVVAIVVIAIISVGVTGCSGPEGPIGPEGPQGPAGSSGADGSDGSDGEGGTPSLQTTYTVTYNSNEGSPVDPEKVIKDGKATKPANPRRVFTTEQIATGGPGLYIAGDGGWIFGGWYLGDALYDFDKSITGNITLTAQWILPSKVSEDSEGIASVPTASDFFVKALDYMVMNPQTYILAIERDYTLTATVTLSTTPAYLTVVGIGGERKIISNTPNGRLAVINNSGTLTIGKNITVVGNAAATTHLFTVQNGVLIMEDGSKITGHTNITATINCNYATAHLIMNGGEISGNKLTGNENFRAIIYINTGATFTMNGGMIRNNEETGTGDFVSGAVIVGGNSVFTMNAGTITGNRAEMTSGQSAGGVMVVPILLNTTPTFIMNGGSITGNFGNHGDVSKTSYTTLNADARPYLYLNKNAVIGTLTSADNYIGVPPSPVYIHADWTGEIQAFNLRGDYAAITGANNSVIWRWTNSKVLEGYPAQSALTNAHIAKINNTYFINNAYPAVSQDISTAGTNGYQISTATDPALKGILIVK
jgi:hypothetical protein